MTIPGIYFAPIFCVKSRYRQIKFTLGLMSIFLTSVSALGSPLCSQIFREHFASDVKSATDAKIVSLLQQEGLRDTLLDQFSTNEIAHAIVSVRAKRERAVESRKKSTNYFEIDLLNPANADIILFFKPTNDIASYRKNGIRGLHESWYSPGGATSNSENTAPHYRERVSSVLAGTNLFPITSIETSRDKEKLFKFFSLQPKSAFLNIKTEVAAVEDYYTSRKVLSYGKIGAVLAEKVKPRSIWTSDDSLKMSENPFEPERGLNVNADNALAKYEDAVDLHSGVFKEQSLLPKVGYTRQFIRPNAPTDYREALVFGEILPSDIDHFIVDEIWIPASALEELKAFGKPIYQWVYDGKSFKNGKLIYQP